MLDVFGTLIFLDAVSSENLNVDHCAFDAAGYALRCVFNVGSFFAKDRPQQFLFRGQLGFALGCHLANKNVAGANFGADVNNARLIQLGQRAFANVGNITGDFLWPQLGVASDTSQFLYVDAGKSILFDHALRYQNGIFEVVSIPRHERDAHILAQSQFTHVDGRTISKYVAGADHITWLDQGSLVDTGVLIGAGKFCQGVDIHTRIARFYFRVSDPDHDTTGINTVYHATTFGDDADSGIQSDIALHTGANKRLFSAERWHSLALHIRAHERSVSIIMLQERNQRCCD